MNIKSMVRSQSNSVTDSQMLKLSTDNVIDIIRESSEMTILMDKAGVIKGCFINSNCNLDKVIESWKGKNIKKYLTVESITKLETLLSHDATESSTSYGPIELNHVDEKNHEFPISYTAHFLESNNQILLTGRDLQPVAEIQQQLISTQLSLEREYEKYRGYDTRFRVTLETINENILFLNAGSGRIVDINSSATKLLGQKANSLIGSSLHSALKDQSNDKLLNSLKSQMSADEQIPTVVTIKNKNQKVKIIATQFRANTEILIICLMEKIRDSLGLTKGISSALNSLYKNNPDGIVFTDTLGKIIYANESFLIVCDTPVFEDISGKSLGDFLARGPTDLKLLLDNTDNNGKVSPYTTKFQSAFGRQIVVELSGIRLEEQNLVKFAFCIRDVSHIENDRQDSVKTSQKSVQTVMKLVGSAPLKELVAETSDVVERICIQTAIEMTDNNRVAAAELLGVSRQSLYVKLRKYKLMNKEADENSQPQ